MMDLSDSHAYATFGHVWQLMPVINKMVNHVHHTPQTFLWPRLSYEPGEEDRVEFFDVEDRSWFYGTLSKFAKSEEFLKER